MDTPDTTLDETTTLHHGAKRMKLKQPLITQTTKEKETKTKTIILVGWVTNDTLLT